MRSPPDGSAHVAGGCRVRPPADRQLPQHRVLQQHRDVDLVPFGSPTIDNAGTFRQSATDADNHCRRNCGRRLCAGPDRAVAPRPGYGGRAVRSLRSRVSQQPQRRHARPRRQSGVAARGRRRQADQAAVALRELQRVVSAELRRSVLLADHDHPAGRSPKSSTTTSSGAKWDVRRLALTTAVYRLDRTNTRSTDPERSDAHRPDRQPAHQRVSSSASTDASRRAGASPAATRIRMRSSPAPPPRHEKGRRWARCRITPSRCGTTTRSIRGSAAALGVIHRTDMFAAIDNTVTLPGYTRADAAVFFVDEATAAAGQRRESLRQAVLRERRQQHEHLAGISAGAPGQSDNGILIQSPSRSGEANNGDQEVRRFTFRHPQFQHDARFGVGFSFDLPNGTGAIGLVSDGPGDDGDGCCARSRADQSLQRL